MNYDHGTAMKIGAKLFALGIKDKF